MSAVLEQFSPGTLVTARGRDWVVQPESSVGVLRLRPFGGSEEDIVTLVPALEFEQLKAATFAYPDALQPGTHDAARLLNDALKLKLRNGAGPFRSFGNIAVEPRAYQLAPLLMALRLPIVRLLIADDVGVGKTIEAGLIARELLDRGEISRMAVLCPPHLVDQWQQELSERFQLQAVALTASSVSKLEKNLPHGVTLFDQYPYVVVSLDYIKSERHREHFLSIAPELIIVDEAHTCASSGQGKQLRFELLKRLVANTERHMLLLTATPHSGDETAFYNLLSLLKPEFAELQVLGAKTDSPLRKELALHFIQRRRKDIEEWQDTSVFPRRLTAEITYKLTGRWGTFFDTVQEYCVELAKRTEQQEAGAHLIWYVTLALLRCVASSPAAAEKALTTRLQGSAADLQALADEETVLDGTADDLSGTDIEPAAQLEDIAYLQLLIEEAQKLAGAKDDPKLKTLIQHVELLLNDGLRPVIFCRYIATAHYVAEHLQQHFKKATVDAITGEYTPEEREVRVSQLSEAALPILVATDCLSEGINLQHVFTAVVHYDLAWNPTRHEQREGRVDRFGQKSPTVRTTILYGEDNPVDGFVLNVILRKAEAIRKELGVMVPMPANERSINQALIKAALMKRSQTARQPELNLGFADEPMQNMEVEWQDAIAKAKKSNTVFAQVGLHPQEVLPEWEKQQQLLGDESDVARFVGGALHRMGTPLETLGNQVLKLLPEHLPQTLRERLKDEGMEKATKISFQYPPANGCHYIHRSHPLVALLADHLLEGAFNDAKPLAARCAATITEQVEVVTTLYLLRLRHQLSVTRKGVTRQMMAEETVALALQGRSQPQWLADADANLLLSATPSGNLSREASSREITLALDYLRHNTAMLNQLGKDRAQSLLDDHTRVRKIVQQRGRGLRIEDVGQTKVQACLPVDVMGVYVLLPDSL